MSANMIYDFSLLLIIVQKTTYFYFKCKKSYKSFYLKQGCQVKPFAPPPLLTNLVIDARGAASSTDSAFMDFLSYNPDVSRQ